MDPAKKAELHQGMQEGIARGHGGFDIALTPMLCGLLGFWIDSQFGWVPVLTVAFTVLGFIGVVVKTYYVYQYRMNLELERRAAKASL